MVLTWENKSRVPDVYFAFSEGFDYREYVEEKSHFDEVVLAVDNSTAEIVGSADRLTHRIGEGVQILAGSIDQVGQVMEKGFDAVQGKLGDIDNTLERGFSSVSFKLEVIDSSVQDLAVICDIGFNRVAAQTARSNELLEDLISLIKTPDQVWAREQYEYAKECMSRDLWEDALGFSRKAINGDDRNAGLYIEPAFHFLQGDILLHFPEVGEGDEFVKRALESFQSGAKYCGKKQDELKALCLLRASWCHYCSGQKEEAVSAIKKAQELDNTALGDFHLAKYTASDCEGGISIPLFQAILLDELLYLRATNDADFIKNVNLEETAKKALESRKREFDKFCKEILHYEDMQEIAAIAEETGRKNQLRGLEEMKSLIRRVDEVKNDLTLTSLNDFLVRGGDEDYSSEAHRVGSRIRDLGNSVGQKLEEVIDDLKATTHQSRVAHVEAESVEPEKYFLLAGGGAFVVWFLIILPMIKGWGFWDYYPTNVGNPWPVIITIPVSGILAAISAPILGGIFTFGAVSSAKSKAAGEQRRQQAQLDAKNRAAHTVAQAASGKGYLLEKRLKKVANRFESGHPKKGRGCNNCEGLGMVNKADGFFTTKVACPDCS